MKKLAIFALAAVSCGALAQSVGVGAGGAIPDGTNSTLTPGLLTSRITLPAVVSIKHISLIGLHHTWAGDLKAIVTAPGGASFSLFVRVGRPGPDGYGPNAGNFGDSSNFGSDNPPPLTGRDYHFVAAGGANLWTTAAGIGGTIGIPSGTYNASGVGSGAPTGLFPGSYGAGDWVLSLTDNAEFDEGAMEAWSITYNPVPEPATMAALGLGFAALVARRRRK
jgi:hypothetical protein